MTYYVNQNCIKCKLTDCVEVCPVDCFYEGENMLAINPDECIDCGVCEPECPIDAIKPDSFEEPDKEKWIETNKKVSSGEDRWPVITKIKEPMLDSDTYRPENYGKDKSEFFSDKPGTGDKK
jgi:ferredoxin